MSESENMADMTKEEAEKALREGLKNYDWQAHCRRVDEAIAPQIEFYRIARAKSYASAETQGFRLISYHNNPF